LVPRLAWDGGSLESVELLPAVESADVVVIVTDHSSYEWRAVVDAARRVVDTRNATRGITSPKILKL
jgi:UDP-N-acetyl-D-glucosamine dehydrogenase